MSRFIDAELLEREMYHESMEVDSDLARWDSGRWIRYKLFENVMDRQKKVDVAEVVRCKDCKHWKQAEKPWDKGHYCEWAGWMIGAMGFCVYGERDTE